MALALGLGAGARWRKGQTEKRLEHVESKHSVDVSDCKCNREACNLMLLEKFSEFTRTLSDVRDLFKEEHKLSEINSRALYELTLTVKLLGERLDAYIVTGRQSNLLDKYGKWTGLNSG